MPFSTCIKELEFDKIIEYIAEHCHCAMGKLLAEKLYPSLNQEAIVQQMQLLDDLRLCVINGLEFNFEELKDLKYLFEDSANTVMGWEEFTLIYQNLQISNKVYSSIAYLENHPHIKKQLSTLTCCDEITSRYNMIFDAEGEVLDSASNELKNIRKQINSHRNRIMKTLNAYVQNPQNERFLQDKFVTQREDRFVVPVKEGQAAFVKGIVQNYSGSKATVFIEPEEIVPINNELQMLKRDEKREIYRIFTEYSAQIYKHKTDIIQNTELCAKLDFWYACARMGKELQSVIPQLTTKPIVRLERARHPLLILKFKDVNKVIPFDLNFDGEENIILLSGPNTGGKTVLLKSVGLLLLMAMSGLPVPVSTNSVLGTFSDIFTDIGDSQSIEEALSTYSAHLDKVAKTLLKCNETTLILIDEIGAATDPLQGSAIAQAIIENIVEKKSRTIATTHYSPLKVYAEQSEYCINASMQFDMESLTPTYKFIVGLPGDSFAIEVAAALGFDPKIVQRAKELCGTQNLEFTNLLRQLQEEKKQYGVNNYQMQLKTRNLEAKIAEYDKILKAIESEKKEIKRNYLKEQQTELAAMQKRLLNELEEIKEMDKDLRRVKLNEKINQLQDQQQKIIKETNSSSMSNLTPINDPQAGEMVWLSDFETNAKIIETQGDDIIVDMNGITFKTKSDNVYSVHETPIQRTALSAFYHAQTSAKLELKLLGLTFDEAQPLIDEFIDNALYCGLHQLRIVHGKGTGALRSKVREYLKKKKNIKLMTTPPNNAGGSGVTIVSL